MRLWTNNLLRLMSERGLKARGLSIQAGLNPTAVRDILKGRSRFPRYSTIVALANVLKVTPEILMRHNNENQDYPDRSQSVDRLKPQTIENYIHALKDILDFLQTHLNKPGSRDEAESFDIAFAHNNSVGNQLITLTAKEKNILTWVAAGKTDDEIAILLSLSRHTINKHLRGLYEKLNANSRTLAVVRGISMGLIKFELSNKSRPINRA
jgi:DNA-binding CsgD family transcriptional regulator/lambda repressor-like predicted transcriptional regulator